MNYLQANLLLLLSWLVFCTGKHFDNRIVGGSDADIKDHPYQLALISGGDTLRGGAVIISDTWALTSPRNLDGQPLSNLTVRAGSSIWFEGGSLHQIVDSLAHDLYTRDSHDYSLALIKVDPPFVFGPGVAAGRIPAQNQDVRVGADSLVSGWGGNVPGSVAGAPSDILQVAVIPVLDIAVCQNEYHDDNITERMLCAGREMFEPDSLDACNGDEGGPMVVDGVIVGLVSWHNFVGCGYYGLPSVYTKVSSMTTWFLTTSGMCCNAAAATLRVQGTLALLGVWWVARWVLA